jgi:hypothetical protein
MTDKIVPPLDLILSSLLGLSWASYAQQPVASWSTTYHLYPARLRLFIGSTILLAISLEGLLTLVWLVSSLKKPPRRSSNITELIFGVWHSVCGKASPDPEQIGHN